MLIDAAVLAGGRSSRLGSVAKATLRVQGRSLLEHALSAASSVARTCIVVGPIDPDLVDTTVFITRENPPFSGPAAALAAGVHHLATNGTSESDAILVLACDMPGIAAQVPALVDALAAAPADVDGVISVDATGHRQPLACLYRRRALQSALARFDADGLTGLSMRKLIEPLRLEPVVALPGATDDVDTWEDAARLGATDPTTETKEAAQ
ncbi:molybdenum cofactor guanylyltransferase [Salinibacterium sp. SWN1162]|uniref:molybdenum cofactor guanylyltransferase n=1 Tax=Salinibacterium sp. SWN1162 TaxID=2792053 RepID=UPI0018CD1D25|nr:molybdenum cofactor guanylyltransferase [Salinibacterium sp. SWN1162]MBH0008375.1 molybdenum cofactor guanylyltransferase [Salinibacterium sp. SWN1162]